MRSVKDRIAHFIKTKGITTIDFERSIGVSSGYVKNISKSVQPDKLETISDLYPELNIEWLLIGKGEMLKPDTAPNVQLSDRSANYQGTFTEPINTILGGSGNTIGASARERIAKKKAEKGIGTQPEAIQLMHEIQILNVENEKLKAEIEHLKENLRLKDTVIQAKDEVIKLLAEKK